MNSSEEQQFKLNFNASKLVNNVGGHLKSYLSEEHLNQDLNLDWLGDNIQITDNRNIDNNNNNNNEMLFLKRRSNVQGNSRCALDTSQMVNSVVNSNKLVKASELLNLNSCETINTNNLIGCKLVSRNGMVSPNNMMDSSKVTSASDLVIGNQFNSKANLCSSEKVISNDLVNSSAVNGSSTKSIMETTDKINSIETNSIVKQNKLTSSGIFGSIDLWPATVKLFGCDSNLSSPNQYQLKLVWKNVILISSLHILAICAFIKFLIEPRVKWQTSVATFAFGLFSSSLGRVISMSLKEYYLFKLVNSKYSNFMQFQTLQLHGIKCYNYQIQLF